MNIRVGIMKSSEISLEFSGRYQDEKGKFITGAHRFEAAALHGVKCFDPDSEGATVSVAGVTIGIGFHWQMMETQTLPGKIELIADAGEIRLVNELPLEIYLQSVVSSEMSAEAPVEFLKAHAVVSRSWAARRVLNDRGVACDDLNPYAGGAEEICVWHDGDAHQGYDVCADDHCQRYQGLSRIKNPRAREAVDATAGEILMRDGQICDARFSKCCGGAMETFENCWAPTPLPYLQGCRDHADCGVPDLSDELEAREWILTRPEAYCADPDPRLLHTVLNSYDLPTTDFYRWQETVTSPCLRENILRKTGRDLGEILNLQVLQRGASGRAVKLRIKGTRASLTVGKELEIRRLLSLSHLKSSAFIIEPVSEGKWRLRGAGWGHGVGMCQIGAAVMASRGAGYRAILSHYYPGSTIASLRGQRE